MDAIKQEAQIKNNLFFYLSVEDGTPIEVKEISSDIREVTHGEDKLEIST